jgi:hypothetical protein
VNDQNKRSLLNPKRWAGHQNKRPKSPEGKHIDTTSRPRQISETIPDSAASSVTIPKATVKQPDVFWPRDILGRDSRFDDARIMTYGYDSHVTKWFSEAQSHDKVESLSAGRISELIGLRNNIVRVVICRLQHRKLISPILAITFRAFRRDRHGRGD